MLGAVRCQTRPLPTGNYRRVVRNAGLGRIRGYS